MLNKLLVPLDGSELAERSLLYVKELAAGFNSEIQLIFVDDVRHDATHRHLHEMYMDEISQQLRDQVSQTGSKSTIKVVTRDGEAASEVITYADENNVDLVVITSHGSTGIMPWTMGGVASKLVQHADFPILLIRSNGIKPKYWPVRNFSSILVPLDGSEISESVIPHVKEIAQVLKSGVILMRVVEPVLHVRTIGGPDHFAYTDQQVGEMKLEATEYLNKLSLEFSGTGSSISTELRVGNAANEIIKFAADSKIRLIAMSSHGKSGVSKWVLGSVSDKVVHAGKTSILLIKHKIHLKENFDS
jgi:nucleotide-binding universal stress UspA family protein